MEGRESDVYSEEDDAGFDVESISSSLGNDKSVEHSPIPSPQQKPYQPISSVPTATIVTSTYLVQEQPQRADYGHYEQSHSQYYNSNLSNQIGYQSMDETGDIDHCGHFLCSILFFPLWFIIWISSCLCDCCLTPCCGFRLSGKPGLNEISD